MLVSDSKIIDCDYGLGLRVGKMSTKDNATQE